jgi:hypothetical protein
MEAKLQPTIRARSQALQQIYNKLHQNQQALGVTVAAYKRLAETPLFDPIFYTSLYDDVEKSGLDPLVHYVLFGATEARQPHPLFDCSYYLHQLSDGKKNIRNALLHYLKVGHAIGKSPNPLFDNEFYEQYDVPPELAPLEHYLLYAIEKQLNPHPLFNTMFYVSGCYDVNFTNINPLAHFCLLGSHEGRLPHLLFHSAHYLYQLGISQLDQARLMDGDRDELLQCLYTKSLELQQNNPRFTNPLFHYLKFGIAELRDPHPLFSTSYYLQNNPDVVANGINPLIHYVQSGQAEHRNPHRLFDTKYYLSQLSSSDKAAEANSSPLMHFLKPNKEDHVSPHPYFDIEFYRSRNPDISLHKLNPLDHYIRVSRYGARLLPNKWFDGNFYSSYYADVNPSGVSPLEHYLIFGKPQGRACNFFSWSVKHGLQNDFNDRPIDLGDIRFSITDKEPETTIVLFGFAEPENLQHCLYAVAKQTSGKSVEIIAQSCSAHELGLFAKFPILTLSNSDRNSESAFCNLAATKARAPLLLFLNKNARPISDWYDKLFAAIRNGTQNNIVGSSLLTPLGRIRNLGCNISKDGNIDHILSYYDGLTPEFEKLSTVEFCEKHALILRKETFEQLSGFDVSIGSRIFEDADFANRAAQISVSSLCESGSRVVLLNQFGAEGDERWPLDSDDLTGRKHFLERWSS